ncbi:hypothetical protein F5B22DRAFT_652770 [Xylaria bambusicola]|uniref:uncharacterized protein n=1 Tax=Xylaria bambusicola TaxID=326684 RepID=UPI002007AC0C|nr:uncharacterized protein F5B22DRAFT_652770 [Xylaria bambusicola]KAI0502766.1 hypothetical protein F5B22DRAFT_652770 [Xylaria bambusicola]
MYTPKLLALALALLPAALAQWPSCDPSCKSCGLYCNEGCVAPLDLTECQRCLYCRRESSSCGYVDISGGWTENPPDPAYCAQCSAGCHCRIDAKCYDGITITPPSSFTPTATPVPPPSLRRG